MKQHDFVLVNADTDSISFCKKDSTPFTEEETESLLMKSILYFQKELILKTMASLKKLSLSKLKIMFSGTVKKSKQKDQH